VIKSQSLPTTEALNLCAQVAEALHYAHSKGITHRDIKPSNIILTPDKRTKLTDFGIARIEDPETAQMTQAGDILGTPVYMAPEQVLGQQADGRTDLYALGVILYEMLVGKRPFAGGNIAAIFRSITHDPPQDPMRAGAVDNRRLADLILKCLAKDRAHRFQSGAAMADALKRCLDAGDHPFAELGHQTEPSGSKRATVVAVALVCGCLAAGVLGYTLMRAPEEQPTSVAEDPKPLAASLLDVTSNPVGAHVFVDSAFKGSTPVSIPLVPGNYEIRLNLTGYYEWEAQLEIGTDDRMPLDVRLVSID
jgi:serine/threonine protein kinase